MRDNLRRAAHIAALGGALFAAHGKALAQQGTPSGGDPTEIAQDLLRTSGQELEGNGSFVVHNFISSTEKRVHVQPGSPLARGLVAAALKGPKTEHYYLDYEDYETLEKWWTGSAQGSSDFAKIVCEHRPTVFFSKIFTRDTFEKTPAYADAPAMLSCIASYQAALPVEFASGGYYQEGIGDMTTKVIAYVSQHAPDAFKTHFKAQLKDAYRSVSTERIVQMTPGVATYVFDAAAEDSVVARYRESLDSVETIARAVYDHRNYEDNNKVMYSPDVHARFRSVLLDVISVRIAQIIQQVSLNSTYQIDSPISSALRYRSEKQKDFSNFDKSNLEKIHPDLAQLIPALHDFMKLSFDDMPSTFFAHYLNARSTIVKDLNFFDRYNDLVPDTMTRSQVIQAARPLINIPALTKLVETVPTYELRTHFTALLEVDEKLGILALQRYLADAESRFTADPFAMIKATTGLHVIVADRKGTSPEFSRVFTDFKKKAFAAFSDRSKAGYLRGDARILFSVMSAPSRGPFVLELLDSGKLHFPQDYTPTDFIAEYKSGMSALYEPWAVYNRTLPRSGPEAQYYLHRQFKILLARGVPSEIIAQQITDGTFAKIVHKEKELSAYWDIFGIRYDSRGAVIKKLQMLDITQPAPYAELLAELDRESAFSGVSDHLMRSVDFTQFDAHARSMLQSGSIEQLVEQIITFGNQTRPQNIQTYFERIARANPGAFSQWVRSFAEKRHVALTAATLPKLWSLTQAATYAGRDDFHALAYGSDASNKQPVVLNIDRTFFESIQTPQQWAQLQSLIAFLDAEQKNMTHDSRFNVLFDGITDQTAALEALKVAALSIDLTMLLRQQGAAFPDPAVVELVRAQINAVSRQEGDRLVITSAAQYLRGKDSVQDINELMRFGKTWAEFGKNLRFSSQRDVAGIYQLVSNFAFGKVAALLSKKEATAQQRAEHTQYLLDAGFHVDERESDWVKGVKRFASDPAGTTAKGARKLMGAQETSIKEYSTAAYERLMQEGVSVEYVCMNMRNCAPNDANMLLLKADPNFVEVGLITNKSGTVDREAIKKERAERMTAIFPVTFTSGPRKLTDLAAYKGEMMSWLLKIDGNDGLVIATEKGMMGILNKQSVRLTELRALGVTLPEDKLKGKEVLEITKSLEDFELFVQIVTSARLSLQTNMLLLSDGERYRVSSDSLDSRRLLLTFSDGTIGMLSSFMKGRHISTNDAVALAEKLGAKRAVYCDTGMYDFAQIFDVTQRPHTIGWQDSEVSTNVAVMSARKRP